MTRSSAPPPTRPARLRRGLAALGAGAALTLALGVPALPAYAHDELLSSNPADGTTLAQPPAQVVLTFSEAPVELGAQVVVTGPSGPVTDGNPRVDGDDVVADLQPGAPAGRYTVEWRVTSGDGHPVSGSFGFTAQAAGAGATPAAATPSAVAASPTPAPAETPRREPLIPSWGWIAAGVIVIAAAIRMNRRARAVKED